MKHKIRVALYLGHLLVHRLGLTYFFNHHLIRDIFFFLRFTLQSTSSLLSMLLQTLGQYVILSAVCGVRLVSAAANYAQSVSDMDDFAEAIAQAKTSLDNYSGGTLDVVGVANAITNVRNAAQTARRSLAGGD
jgi:hypothetical protein